MAWRQAAIAGVGAIRQGKLLGETPLSLAAEAFRLGSRSEHLGWIAVTCRRHASMNPHAVMRDPISIDDHPNSRLIVDPLRLLDCCLISDGAVGVIVTSPERARDCAKPPVAIWGMGQGHTTGNLRVRDWCQRQARSRSRCQDRIPAAGRSSVDSRVRTGGALIGGVRSAG